MFELSLTRRIFRWLRSTSLICLSFLLLPPLAATSPSKEDLRQRDYKNCMSCHKGIEAISPNHPFACAECHLRPKDRHSKPLRSHQAILRNPSDPQFVRQFCLPCHEKEISTLEHSLHWSMAGIINQTRFLWGAQKTAAPAIYGVKAPLKPLPEADFSKPPEIPADLVDDFLRRRCLRCHIHTKGPGGVGFYRATGCAACHMHYDDDGLYRG
ncbi:MAG TPA: hypothetical protein VKA69_02455, partial [Desulfobacteria bacterium]|nr:hypothetical protein [Desulfobacteria bacterium]